MRICVFGSGSNDIDESYKTACYQLGKQLGENGHSIVFGGSRNGLMGEIGKGCKAGGGRLIGVIPEILNDPSRYHQDCDELIITDDITVRKVKMLDMAEGVLILPGGVGTYDEMFEIIVRKELGYGYKDNPIIFFNLNGYYDTLFKFLSETYEKGFMPETIFEEYQIAKTIEDVLNILKGEK